MKKVKTAFVHLTNECNSKCLHCFTDSGKKKDNELDTKESIDLINQIKRYGVNKIVFEGGEPLLREDIQKIVDKVWGDVELAITTNSSLLDDKYLKSFKGKVQRIGFSLDGAKPETHDFLRQRKGSFNETINNIKKALDYNYKVNVWYVVSRPNLSEVYLIPELLEREGLDSINLLSFFNCSKVGRAKTNWDKLKISEEEWRTHLKLMEEITGKYDNIMFEPGTIPREDKPKYERSYPACNLYRDELSVRVDPIGNIGICSLLFDMDFSLGNIREDNFDNILNKSEMWERLKDYESKVKEACEPCKDYSFCKGGCIAYSSFDEKNIKMDERCNRDFIPLCLNYFHKFKK